jgi:hypothetical protein
VPTLKELYQEMHVIGYRFEMRSDEDYDCDEQFVWAGLTVRVKSKRRDDGDKLVPNWPWRFMYGFEVSAMEETSGLRRGRI